MNDFYVGGLGKDRKVEFYNGSTFLRFTYRKTLHFSHVDENKITTSGSYLVNWNGR